MSLLLAQGYMRINSEEDEYENNGVQDDGTCSKQLTETDSASYNEYGEPCPTSVDKKNCHASSTSEPLPLQGEKDDSMSDAALGVNRNEAAARDQESMVFGSVRLASGTFEYKQLSSGKKANEGAGAGDDTFQVSLSDVDSLSISHDIDSNGSIHSINASHTTQPRSTKDERLHQKDAFQNADISSFRTLSPSSIVLVLVLSVVVALVVLIILFASFLVRILEAQCRK